jgi:hypothetical protein
MARRVKGFKNKTKQNKKKRKENKDENMFCIAK